MARRGALFTPQMRRLDEWAEAPLVSGRSRRLRELSGEDQGGHDRGTTAGSCRKGAPGSKTSLKVRDRPKDSLQDVKYLAQLKRLDELHREHSRLTSRQVCNPEREANAEKNEEQVMALYRPGPAGDAEAVAGDADTNEPGAVIRRIL